MAGLLVGPSLFQPLRILYPHYLPAAAQLFVETTYVIKRCLSADKTFPGCSPIEYKDRQQTRWLWQACSLAALLIDNRRMEHCAETDLGRKIQISCSHRSHVCCFIHRLIWGSANGGRIFVPHRVICNGLINGNTSPSEVFRCEWPVNKTACVRTQLSKICIPCTFWSSHEKHPLPPLGSARCYKLQHFVPH